MAATRKDSPYEKRARRGHGRESGTLRTYVRTSGREVTRNLARGRERWNGAPRNKLFEMVNV